MMFVIGFILVVVFTLLMYCCIRVADTAEERELSDREQTEFIENYLKKSKN